MRKARLDVGAHIDFKKGLDQFFDEAQWESYRRLGYHVGRGDLSLVLR